MQESESIWSKREAARQRAIERWLSLGFSAEAAARHVKCERARTAFLATKAGATYAEIGRGLGVSRSRAREISMLGERLIRHAGKTDVAVELNATTLTPAMRWAAVREVFRPHRAPRRPGHPARLNVRLYWTIHDGDRAVLNTKPWSIPLPPGGIPLVAYADAPRGYAKITIPWARKSISGDLSVGDWIKHIQAEILRDHPNISFHVKDRRNAARL